MFPKIVDHVAYTIDIRILMQLLIILVYEYLGFEVILELLIADMKWASNGMVCFEARLKAWQEQGEA